MHRAAAMVLRVMLLGAVVAVASACAADDHPTDTTATAPAAPPTVDACQRPKSLTVDFRQGDTLADKALALTFDDGPADVTSDLSTYLAEEGIAATFFIDGDNVEGREDVVAKLVTDGHLLGNHGKTGDSLAALSPEEAIAEIATTDAILVGAEPKAKLFFRPPFGDWNDTLAAALNASPMNKYLGPVGWDIGNVVGDHSAADAQCWSDDEAAARSVEECGALYLQEIRQKRRGIVLLHDGPPDGHGDSTLAMVKNLVPVLKSEGYSFTRVDAIPATPAGQVGASAGGNAPDPCATR